MWSRWIRALRHESTASSRKHTATPTHSTSWSMITPTGTLTGVCLVCVRQKMRKGSEAMQNDYCVQGLVQQKHQQSNRCFPLSLCFCLFLSFSESCSSSDSGLGLVDQLLNSRQVRDAPNILILHVTSFPFALQTQYTRISPYNEIHWPSAFSNVRLKSACDTRFVFNIH